jgi:flagellar biosynthesis/type III secretory pathway protein FliH
MFKARVIKQSPACAASSLSTSSVAKQAQIVRAERLQAQEAADKLLQEAQARADRLLEEARHEADRQRESAQREGYEAGIAQAARQAVSIAIAEAELDQRHQLRSVELARALAERIVGRSIELAPNLIEEMAEAALAEVRGARRIRFVVHPNHQQALRDALSSAQLGPMVVEVASDAGLGPADFELHTDVGRLDARLDTRLQALTRALLENLE